MIQEEKAEEYMFFKKIENTHSAREYHELNWPFVADIACGHIRMTEP